MALALVSGHTPSPPSSESVQDMTQRGDTPCPPRLRSGCPLSVGDFRRLWRRDRQECLSYQRSRGAKSTLGVGATRWVARNWGSLRVCASHSVFMVDSPQVQVSHNRLSSSLLLSLKRQRGLAGFIFPMLAPIDLRQLVRTYFWSNVTRLSVANCT